MIGIGFGPFRGPGPLNGGQIENAGSADRKNGTGKSNSLIPNARRIQCESFLHGADEAPRSNPSFHRVFPFPIPHAVEYILRVATFCLFEIPSENTFPPSLSTLRYMGKNSVRLNWSNARKLTTSSGKKIPRFFAEKKKSYPSKITPCLTIQAIFSILRHIEYDSTLGFVFLLTPVCPVLSLSEIYRHVIAFHPVGSNSNRRFNVSIQRTLVSSSFFGEIIAPRKTWFLVNQYIYLLLLWKKY